MKKTIEYENDYGLIEKLRSLIMKASKKITGPGDIYKEVLEYTSSDKEQFIVVLLDGANQIISSELVSIGIANKTIVHPREVFRTAIAKNACSIALAHNHPSGLLEPSIEDLSLTNRLKEAGSIIGIPVLDHLIVSKNGYRSMLESGDILF